MPRMLMATHPSILNAPLHTRIPFIGDGRVDKMAFNKENMNALDVIKANINVKYKIFLKHSLKRNGAVSGHRILSENDHDGQKLKENKYGEDTELEKNIRESHLIVATLVATVTFTAGVIMPGYYQSDASGGNAMSKVSKQNVMVPVPAPIKGTTPGYALRGRTYPLAGIYICKLTRSFKMIKRRCHIDWD
ncbi:unnamed protein product [Prunus armeniaca]